MKILKGFIKYVIVFCGLNFILISLLALSYMIPQDKEIEKITEGYTTYLVEGIYSDGKDGYTDLLFLSSSFIEAKKGENPYMMAISNNVSGKAMKEANPLAGLEEILRKADEYTPYSNYFAGSTAIFKILFTKINLLTIRYIFTFLTILGILFVCAYIFKYVGNFRAVLPFACMCFFGNLLNTCECLTFGIDILLMLAAAVVVCFFHRKGATIKKYNLLFFVVGMMTFFLNYWSFPIFSLVVPVTLLVTLNLDKVGNEMLRRTVSCVIAWGIGFGLEIGLRFITSIIFLDGGTIAEHLRAYTSQDSSFDRGLSRFETLDKLFEQFFVPKTKAILVIIVIILCAFIVRKIVYYKKLQIREQWVSLVMLVGISLIPIVWLLILYNHTFHGFDNLLLCATIYPFLSILAILGNRSDISERM
ncbi:MAG: hypothetical protein MJ133_01610 [Lachnospiraceae bacterium]|nr:hypothetical protein [Lachnospiraceae bacterium]